MNAQTATIYLQRRESDPGIPSAMTWSAGPRLSNTSEMKHRDDGFSVRSVMALRMQASHKVFAKGVYIEDVDVKEGEDAEPLR
jgi:hypothetical protein